MGDVDRSQPAVQSINAPDRAGRASKLQSFKSLRLDLPISFLARSFNEGYLKEMYPLAAWDYYLIVVDRVNSVALAAY